MSTTVNDLVAAARRVIHEVDAAGLAARSGTASVLIDVREPHEYAAGHLPGAINLPRGVLEFQIDAHPAMACTTSPALADRTRPLLVYCLSGGRSALAAESLQRLGFTRVESLAGGYRAWCEAGHPVTSG